MIWQEIVFSEGKFDALFWNAGIAIDKRRASISSRGPFSRRTISLSDLFGQEAGHTLDTETVLFLMLYSYISITHNLWPRPMAISTLFVFCLNIPR